MPESGLLTRAAGVRSRRERYFEFLQQPRARAAVVALALGGVLLLASLLTRAEDVPFICIFRATTTAPCPSCGMTRAFVAMGHGRWSDAFEANLAGPVVYVAFASLAMLALAQAATGRGTLDVAWAQLRRIIVPVVLVLMGTAWAWNLVQRFAPGAF